MTDSRKKRMPSLDDDLKLPEDEGTSSAAVAAGAVIAGAANIASAVFGALGRRRRDEGNANESEDTQDAKSKTRAHTSALKSAARIELDENAIPIKVKPGTTASNETDADDGEVEIRVSSRAPRARTPKARTRGLASSLLDSVVSQVGDYIEASPAVERMIRTQTDVILRGLMNDSALAELIRAQTEQYLDELAAHPEKLEQLIRAAARSYVAYLTAHPELLDPLVQKIAERYKAQFSSDASRGEVRAAAPQVTRKRPPRAKSRKADSVEVKSLPKKHQVIELAIE